MKKKASKKRAPVKPTTLDELIINSIAVVYNADPKKTIAIISYSVMENGVVIGQNNSRISVLDLNDKRLFIKFLEATERMDFENPIQPQEETI